MGADGRGSWEEAVQWLRGQPDRLTRLLCPSMPTTMILIEAAERYRCSDE